MPITNECPKLVSGGWVEVRACGNAGSTTLAFVSFIAQSVERTAVNREVVGSIPAGGVTLKRKDFDIRNVHATTIVKRHRGRNITCKLCLMQK